MVMPSPMSFAWHKNRCKNQSERLYVFCKTGHEIRRNIITSYKYVSFAHTMKFGQGFDEIGTHHKIIS